MEIRISPISGCMHGREVLSSDFADSVRLTIQQAEVWRHKNLTMFWWKHYLKAMEREISFIDLKWQVIRPSWVPEAQEYEVYCMCYLHAGECPLPAVYLHAWWHNDFSSCYNHQLHGHQSLADCVRTLDTIRESVHNLPAYWVRGRHYTWSDPIRCDTGNTIIPKP